MYGDIFNASINVCYPEGAILEITWKQINKYKIIILDLQPYNEKNNEKQKQCANKNTNIKTGRTDISSLLSERHFQSVY